MKKSDICLRGKNFSVYLQILKEKKHFTDQSSVNSLSRKFLNTERWRTVNKEIQEKRQIKLFFTLSFLIRILFK